jgi:hypothetical protein
MDRVIIRCRIMKTVCLFRHEEAHGSRKEISHAKAQRQSAAAFLRFSLRVFFAPLRENNFSVLRRQRVFSSFVQSQLKDVLRG